jgi:lipoprotein-anchoring transpeptidase ErfK/SrfK
MTYSLKHSAKALEAIRIGCLRGRRLAAWRLVNRGQTAPGRTGLTPLWLAVAVLVALLLPAAAAVADTSLPGETIEADAAVSAPSRALGATVARIVTPVFARRSLTRPDGGHRLQAQTSWSGQAEYLLVLAGAVQGGREWVKVLLPSRPDGSTGWVPRDKVVLGQTPYWVQVSTGSRQVTVFRDGRRLRSFRAVVGAPATPTPHGLGAVYERDPQPDPHGFVGPWVLALTLLSNKLHHFEGGEGRVGIHGRDGASLLDPLGSARSHGCIRIANAAVRWMAAHVPAGTPVRVTG